MINLALDIGNTYIKLGFFKGAQLLQTHSNLKIEAVVKLLENARFEAAIVSSVTVVPDEITSAFTKAQQVLFLGAATKLPFQNLYTTPQTLGTDRIAVVAGGSSLYPEKDLLIIDTGTCVTYDFIDKRRRYQGGSISPGLQMRLKAMHTFTARLPLINTENVLPSEVALTGKNTYDAMLSGAIHGMAAEITQMIRMYADKFAALQVVTCGGDASYLAHIIQQEHTVIPELTLIGLNRILIYNVS